MANLMTGKALRQLKLGMKVDRAAAANGTGTYFTITGGRVLLTLLTGLVTVEAVGATTLTITNIQTTGGTQPDAASLDLDPAIVGSVLTVPLTGSGAATYTASATGLAITATQIATTGALTFTFGAVSGTTSWSLFYIPIDDGAYVTAA